MECCKKYKPQLHDVYMVKSGSTTGKVAIVDTTERFNIWSPLAAMRCGSITNPYFLYFLLQTEDLQDQVFDKASHGTQPNLSMRQLEKFDVVIPANIDEQSALGELFKSFDNLITLHQCKCFHDYNMLVTSKIICNSACFSNTWEQRKFGDIGSVSMCKRIFKEETSAEGDIPFYKIGTFGSEPDAYISRELFEDYKSRFSYPEEGAILLSASGTIGRIVEYKGEEAYFQDSNIVWLSHDKSVSNKFLKVLYPTVKWDGIEGSTIQRLYNDNFLKTRFMMPKLLEQEKLGDFFGVVDNLITLHQCNILQHSYNHFWFI